MSRLRFTADLQTGVRGCDLVLEAVPEDLGLKVRLFRQLDGIVDPGCLLVSNTSGFPISGLAYATDRPQLVLGWHWASPPAVMRFSEIIVHADTDEQAPDRLSSLAQACGKRPVIVKDQPMAWGFVANRVYAAMIREAQRVVDEGVVTAEELDQLMVDCFAWPVGPLGMGRSAQSGWEST
jgi:3-hydroxyacyl-CoA dehydrogenase